MSENIEIINCYAQQELHHVARFIFVQRLIMCGNKIVDVRKYFDVKSQQIASNRLIAILVSLPVPISAMCYIRGCTRE